jgi:hypothetical protein
LKFKPQPASIAVFALLSKRRSATLIREKPCIPASASATSGSEPAVTMSKQFCEHFTRVEVFHDGAFWNLYFEGAAALSMEIFAFAVHTICRPSVRMVTKWQERSHVVVGHEPHIATVSTIATVGATINDRAFTSKRHAPCAAVTPSNIELALINKL